MITEDRQRAYRASNASTPALDNPCGFCIFGDIPTRISPRGYLFHETHTKGVYRLCNDAIWNKVT